MIQSPTSAKCSGSDRCSNTADNSGGGVFCAKFPRRQAAKQLAFFGSALFDAFLQAALMVFRVIYAGEQFFLGFALDDPLANQRQSLRIG